mmetsp:Transcript_49503/g.158274  ORF Transcript_49503/g.158274 Transcript_49503/m.158274 type:complete len:135 (+) Transcript_49503:168-572(+)
MVTESYELAVLIERSRRLFPTNVPRKYCLMKVDESGSRVRPASLEEVEKLQCSIQRSNTAKDTKMIRSPSGTNFKQGGPCDHCGVTESPQWRRGPPSKPHLCNACGTRFRRRGKDKGDKAGGDKEGGCIPSAIL